ncbi:MAG TPA: tetratricopeptide repeat protein [Candidatus Acidoferrales bacterium]|nr:tetratricopeptide repeat protein [Candidatus Acidoferrales bacterium]
MMSPKIIFSLATLAIFSAAPARGAQKAPPAQNGATQPSPAASTITGRAGAYYYFTMGHLDEQQYDQTNDSSMADASIEAYKKALALQPDAAVVRERLAEIEAKSQRIRDAVLDARQAIKDDPNNVDAHRLLAGIYVRTIGDINSGDVQKANLDKATEQFQDILKIKPDDTGAALWLARLYRFENRDSDAEGVLVTFLQHDADNPAALEQLSQIYLEGGEAHKAIDLLSRAANDTASPDVYDLLGSAYLQNKDLPNAEQSYRKAIQADPDEPSHQEGLAKTLFAEQKYTDALSTYKKLAIAEPDKYENYLRIGQIETALGKYDDAGAALEHARQLAPGNLEILNNQAMLYEAQGRHDDAIKVLNDAISGMRQKQSDSSAGENNGEALEFLYQELGQIYGEQGNYPGAIRAYQQMEQLSPEARQHAQTLLADTYERNNDIDDAIAEMKKALDASPKDERLTMNLAMLYGEKADTANATKLLQGLLHGTDADQTIYLALAQTQERGREFTQAEQSAQKAEQMSHETSQKAMAWLMLGDIYEHQKKYEDAERQFRKALDAEPNDPTALNEFGYMLAERGVRLQEATGMIQRAVRQQPGNGAFLDSLGWAYYKQNKLAEAEGYLKKAVDREGHDPTILGHLGDVYLKLGDDEHAEAVMERARAEWRKTPPADYEADKVAQLDAQLRELKRRLAQKSSTGTEKPQ